MKWNTTLIVLKYGRIIKEEMAIDKNGIVLFHPDHNKVGA